MISRVVLLAVLAGLALIVPGDAAWAAPPVNDSFSGATVIPSVPFNTTEDTARATVDAADTAARRACGISVPVSRSVWFAYTPASDQQLLLDASASSYSLVGAVLTGTPAAFTAVSCFADATSFNASKGATYYVVLLQSPAGSAGTLRLSLTQQNLQPTGQLAAVSCMRGMGCVGVGSFFTPAGYQIAATLAERWNGINWSIQRTPNVLCHVSRRTPCSNALASVSCASASACFAVGSTIVGANPDASDVPAALVERWDGTGWTIQTPPLPAGTHGSSLRGITCLSRRLCIAVGAFSTKRHIYKTMPLVERWDGKRWSLQRGATTSGASLNSVSCASAKACTAVGSGPKDGLAERWNGKHWSIQHTPALRHGYSFSGVSCPSATACTAVGSRNIQAASSDGAATSGTLAADWNGTSWTIQPTPNATNPFDCGSSQSSCDNPLSAVWCPSRSHCTAVGSSYYEQTGDEGTMAVAARRNGSTWSLRIVHTRGSSCPNNPFGCDDSLNGVWCASVSACTAVGSHNGQTLAERWNGRRWSLQDTPNPIG